jgi:hypothetical protein
MPLVSYEVQLYGAKTTLSHLYSYNICIIFVDRLYTLPLNLSGHFQPDKQRPPTRDAPEQLQQLTYLSLFGQPSHLHSPCAHEQEELEPEPHELVGEQVVGSDIHKGDTARVLTSSSVRNCKPF